MKAAKWVLGAAILSWPYNAWAQVDGTGASAPDEGTATASEIDQGPGASPDVEKQMDLKTEKAEPVAEPEPEPEPEPNKAPDDADVPESKEVGEDDPYGHAMQVGIRAGFVPSYRIVFRYDDSPFCTRPEFTAEEPYNEQQKICGFGAPFATELALSFAPIDALEPYLYTRLAFEGEEETDTQTSRMFGVGARIYTMSDSRFKVFIEPGVAMEIIKAGSAPQWCNETDLTNLPRRPQGCEDFIPNYPNDVVFHVGIGGQYDFARFVGMYLNVGMDVGVLRAIHAWMMMNVGVQIRVP